MILCRDKTDVFALLLMGLQVHLSCRDWMTHVAFTLFHVPKSKRLVFEYTYITEWRMEETDFWSDVPYSDTLSLPTVPSSD